MEQDDEQEKKDVPGGETEKSEDSIFRGLNYQSWIDDAFSEFEKKGGLETLTGKGEPIIPLTGDPLNHVLKEANVLPRWLELQKEIRGRIKALIEAAAGDPSLDPGPAIKEINQKISAYNSLVPTPILQKMKLRADDFIRQYDKWL